MLRLLLVEWTGVTIPAEDVPRVWARVEATFRRLSSGSTQGLSLQTALLHEFHTRLGLVKEPRIVSDHEIAALRVNAITDPLTGLYNRRFLLDHLEREVSRAERAGGVVSVLMMDLAGFKSINDRLGHPVGDGILVRTAKAIRESLRVVDAGCRYGGDEFVAVLPNSDVVHSLAVAERIRHRVSAIRLPLRLGIKVGLNYGVATFPTDGRLLDFLLKMSDIRLYASKRQNGKPFERTRRYPRFAVPGLTLKVGPPKSRRAAPHRGPGHLLRGDLLPDGSRPDAGPPRGRDPPALRGRAARDRHAEGELGLAAGRARPGGLRVCALSAGRRGGRPGRSRPAESRGGRRLPRPGAPVPVPSRLPRRGRRPGHGRAGARGHRRRGARRGRRARGRRRRARPRSLLRAAAAPRAARPRPLRPRADRRGRERPLARSSSSSSRARRSPRARRGASSSSASTAGSRFSSRSTRRRRSRRRARSSSRRSGPWRRSPPSRPRSGPPERPPRARRARRRAPPPRTTRRTSAPSPPPRGGTRAARSSTTSSRR